MRYCTHGLRRPTLMLAALAAFFWSIPGAFAGESNLVLPDRAAFSNISLLHHMINGYNLLLCGLGICVLGLLFGLFFYQRLRKLPVHKSMLEVSELIYATCKTYLLTQIKFILMLELFIGTIIVVYFGLLSPETAGQWGHVAIILVFSLIGIAGSCSVAAFGIRINTFANSRTALASLAGKPYPCYAIPLQAGMSIGMVLISVELLMMLVILLFIPSTLAGPCFIGFAIGESLGAAALRVAGGIFTKIADIGSDLMKIVFNIKEDDARNPGVIADCTGDNAGDSVGPTADGFETYGVTGVALITFILLGVYKTDPKIQAFLLIWIFAMRLVMLLTSMASYLINESFTHMRYAQAKTMNFETPLTNLVWLGSIISIAATYITSWGLLHGLHHDLWWILATIISCGTLAGALIPETIKIFTSTNSKHVREIVDVSRKGEASFTILSGFICGNFSAFWIGTVVIVGLMAVACGISSCGGADGLAFFMPAHAVFVFAFGLVAFGFLGMGPITIAVDSYGPVTDNAQSVYELSLIETLPNAAAELKKDFGIDVDFERAKMLLEENDGAGNTFKATAKPVLIGTAVVGATCLIFSIILSLTNGLTEHMDNLSILYAPFLLGLISGGGVIFWFAGASCQAVTTGAYRAVAFIKDHMKFDGSQKASTEDSKRVVQICTQYAQAGMFNIFLVVFFITLSFAFVEPYFFVGFLIGLAAFGLYEAIFMANAGAAWDNAKKVVEVELRQKGTPLHAATVVGDTVGDPFKDTSSVALNPIIKFSTLFGLLAAELGHHLALQGQRPLTLILAAVFFLVACVFIIRSFYGMRIGSDPSFQEAQSDKKVAVGAGA